MCGALKALQPTPGSGSGAFHVTHHPLRPPHPHPPHLPLQRCLRRRVRLAGRLLRLGGQRAGGATAQRAGRAASGRVGGPRGGGPVPLRRHRLPHQAGPRLLRLHCSVQRGPPVQEEAHGVPHRPGALRSQGWREKEDHGGQCAACVQARGGRHAVCLHWRPAVLAPA
jgi:hypothetical protein